MSSSVGAQHWVSRSYFHLLEGWLINSFSCCPPGAALCHSLYPKMGMKGLYNQPLAQHTQPFYYFHQHLAVMKLLHGVKVWLYFEQGLSKLNSSYSPDDLLFAASPSVMLTKGSIQCNCWRISLVDKGLELALDSLWCLRLAFSNVHCW